MNADMLNRGTEERPPLFFLLGGQTSPPPPSERSMRKLANIARRVFGNSVQASYFERFHWSILNFWTLQTA
jgi:hypothetical protein